MFRRPAQISAGFGSVLPEPLVPELSEAGEQWADSRFSVKWHRNAGWEIDFQTGGETHWETERGPFQIQGVAFYVIGPAVRHRLARVQGPGCHFYYAVIDPTAIDWKPARCPVDWSRDLIWHGAGGAPLKGPFEMLMREIVRASPHRAIALRAYVRALLVEAARLAIAGATPARFVPQHPGAARARELLENEFERRWTLTELAREVGVSPNHLATVFRKEFGLPPHRYLLQRRLEHADNLLKTSDLSVAAIAQMAGFCSSQHFATSYRATFHRTPRAARK